MQTTSLGCTGMKEYKKKPVKLSKKLCLGIEYELEDEDRYHPDVSWIY